MNQLGWWCALFLSCASAVGAQIELIPRGRPFRLTFADPREIRMQLALSQDTRLNAAIGNYFSLVGFYPEEGDDEVWETHIGIEGAGFFTMRQADRRFPLESVDGLIGLYGEGSRDDWQWQIRYTHISAHLADGSAGPAIPYSRETLSARFGYLVVPELHVYGGLHWIVNTTPDVPRLGFQMGGAYFLDAESRRVTPYLATDLRWRRETDSDPSWSVQAGIALNNPPESFRSFRLYYLYFTGADPRGQFFSRSYTTHSVGIEMQI